MLNLQDHESLLGHPLRTALLQLSQTDPGIPLMDCLRRLKSVPAHSSLGYGTLSHHLYVLERAGLVTSRRSGRNRRYYPARSRLGDPTALSVLQRPGMFAIVRALLLIGEGSQSQILADVQAQRAITRHGVKHHLANLESAGLATSSRLGRHRIYRPTPSLERAAQEFAQHIQRNQALTIESRSRESDSVRPPIDSESPLMDVPT